MAQPPITRVSVTREGDPSKPAAIAQGQAARTYAALASQRQPYLERARRLSELTLPSLFRPDSADGGEDTQLPWNSIGAYLVNNLSAKVVLSMFPAGRPPMKLSQDRRSAVDLVMMAEEDPEGAARLKEEIETGLSKVEQEFSEAMEEDGDRARLSVAARKMIVGGNHGFKFQADGNLRGISLHKYVTRRAPDGSLLEFVVEEKIAWETASPDIREICRRNGYRTDPDRPLQQPIPVYTHGRLSVSGATGAGQAWTIYQEVHSELVPGSKYTRTPDALDFLFLTWNLLDEEHYGRSYAEDYEADLQTVDGLEQSISEGAAAMARFLQLVNPTGLTDKRQVANARNGDTISGRADDVTTLRADKAGDFAVASSQQDKVLLRLGRAFLVTTGTVRDAERVTKAEVAAVIAELEEQLGGVYSEQVVSWQLPYVRKKLASYQRQGRVTRLPANSVKMTILGGMAALGRHAELAALDAWLGGMSAHFGPEAVAQALTPTGIRAYAVRRAAALGVDIKGILPSEEQAAQQEQTGQMQALIAQLGPEALRQFGTNQTANQVAETNAASREAIAASRPTAPSTPTAQ